MPSGGGAAQLWRGARWWSPAQLLRGVIGVLCSDWLFGRQLCSVAERKVVGAFLQKDFGFGGRGSLQNVTPLLDLKWMHQIVREQETSGSTRYFAWELGRWASHEIASQAAQVGKEKGGQLSQFQENSPRLVRK
jgi:hypothetical protein